MVLTRGSRVGAYEITGAIGAGGMGEVYRATDSRLKREVALKVLRSSVAQDADRVARFQREAEVLASLNHPHIAQIYGIEDAGGTTTLVMELVEGEDLGCRRRGDDLARGGRGRKRRHMAAGRRSTFRRPRRADSLHHYGRDRW
jgi:serine/threonine protein kinase